eukprot:3143212-Prymnesium_polylepis.1
MATENALRARCVPAWMSGVMCGPSSLGRTLVGWARGPLGPGHYREPCGTEPISDHKSLTLE